MFGAFLPLFTMGDLPVPSTDNPVLDAIDLVRSNKAGPDEFIEERIVVDGLVREYQGTKFSPLKLDSALNVCEAGNSKEEESSGQ